jgi:hypothetical protein
VSFYFYGPRFIFCAAAVEGAFMQEGTGRFISKSCGFYNQRLVLIVLPIAPQVF